MAIKFLTSEYCYIGSTSWLDNVTAFSFHCRVRFDTLGTASQFVFRVRNGTSGDQISLRRDAVASSGDFRFSVTTNGGTQNKQIDSSFNPVAGTIYDITCTWQAGAASGMAIYINGVLDASGTDTTSQTLAYTTSGNGTLMIGARPSAPATEYGQCTLEHLAFWPGRVLDANRALALHQGARVHRIGVPLPAAYYPMYDNQIATIIDQSGNDRKIVDGNAGGSPATDIIGGAANAPLRPIQPAWWDDVAWLQAASSGSGPPAENPWTAWTPDVDDPQDEVVITGLSNGTTYQFKVIAIDDTGNPSSDSAVVEATPTVVASSVTTPAPWRRTRYLTKYRS